MRRPMLRLWGRPTSTRTLKVLWTLSEIGIEFEFILASATMGPQGSVDKGNRPYGIVDTAAYRAMNPNGTIPTIDDVGFVLWESNAIVRYLAMQSAPELMYGVYTQTFARAVRWMDWDNNELMPGQHVLVMQLVRLRQELRDATVIEKVRAEQIPALRVIDAELGRTPYIAGDRFSMGDIPLGIHVHRWLLYDIDRPAMTDRKSTRLNSS